MLRMWIFTANIKTIYEKTYFIYFTFICRDKCSKQISIWNWWSFRIKRPNKYLWCLFLSFDYSSVAEFKSGIGEYVDFYPSEFKNLNTNSITKGLKILIKVMVPSIGLDGKITNTALFRSIMLDDSEVKLFISFLEKHVGPKVGKADKKDPKKYETTIKFKEMIFTYASEGKSERITMYARNYGVTGREKGETFIEFWTESQVDKVADLILVLKKII